MGAGDWRARVRSSLSCECWDSPGLAGLCCCLAALRSVLPSFAAGGSRGLDVNNHQTDPGTTLQLGDAAATYGAYAVGDARLLEPVKEALAPCSWLS